MCDTGTGNTNYDVHLHPHQLNFGGPVHVNDDKQELFIPIKVIQCCQQSITTHPTDWRGSSQQKMHASFRDRD